MDRFQYQQRAEPLSQSRESVTVDRWNQPLVQPRRRTQSVRAAVAEPVYTPVVAADVYLDWEPVGGRVIRRTDRRQSQSADVLSTAAEVNYFPQWEQVGGRSVKRVRQPPTQPTEVVSVSAEVNYHPAWLVSHERPKRPLPRPRGDAVAPLEPTLLGLSVPIDGWLVEHRGAVRRMVRPRGDAIAPLEPTNLGLPVPPDSWLVEHRGAVKRVVRPRGDLFGPVDTTPGQTPTPLDGWLVEHRARLRQLPRPRGDVIAPLEPTLLGLPVSVSGWFVQFIAPVRRKQSTRADNPEPPYVAPVTPAPALDSWSPSVASRTRPIVRPRSDAIAPLEPTLLGLPVPVESWRQYPVVRVPRVRAVRGEIAGVVSTVAGATPTVVVVDDEFDLEILRAEVFDIEIVRSDSFDVDIKRSETWDDPLS